MMQRACRWTAPALLAAAECRAEQSVFAPHGPRAAEIAQLGWILIAICAAVLAVVVVAAWFAVRGSPRLRSRLASERAVTIGGIAFPAVVLTGLLGYGVWLMQISQRAGDGEDAERIEVVGEQWWWRISYHAGAERVPSANEIRIPVGRDVAFTLTSADVIHSFWVPSLGGKVDMIPGRTTQLRVRADRPGVYRGQCAEYCGGPHALMAFYVIAMPRPAFEDWLAREAAVAGEPRDQAAQKGKALFLAAGCGACHAVRGTPAAGTVGPDLTHVGGRRSIGADAAPLTHASLVRFVADGQHLKPGNLMPQFRIFSEQERDALAAYLVSLR